MSNLVDYEKLAEDIANDVSTCAFSTQEGMDIAMQRIRRHTRAAFKAALSEQEAAYLCHQCNKQVPPPENFRLCVHCRDCGATTSATIAADLGTPPQPQKGETPQSVEEWIEENEIWNGCIPADKARDFMAGKALVPVEPTDEMLNAARDWSDRKYGKPIGNDAAAGCYSVMLEAAMGEL